MSLSPPRGRTRRHRMLRSRTASPERAVRSPVEKRRLAERTPLCGRVIVPDRVGEPAGDVALGDTWRHVASGKPSARCARYRCRTEPGGSNACRVASLKAAAQAGGLVAWRSGPRRSESLELHRAAGKARCSRRASRHEAQTGDLRRSRLAIVDRRAPQLRGPRCRSSTNAGYRGDRRAPRAAACSPRRSAHRGRRSARRGGHVSHAKAHGTSRRREQPAALDPEGIGDLVEGPLEADQGRVDPVLQRRAGRFTQMERERGRAALPNGRVRQPDRRHQVALRERRRRTRESIRAAVIHRQRAPARVDLLMSSAISTDQRGRSRVSWTILAPVIDLDRPRMTGWRWTYRIGGESPQGVDAGGTAS